MKTIFDELQQEVKNWWISLILGNPLAELK